MLDQDCGTLYLSLTKCKSDVILLDGLTDPVAVQYIFLKVEIYNFIFAGFSCESKDVVTFPVQPQGQPSGATNGKFRGKDLKTTTKRE